VGISLVSWFTSFQSFAIGLRPSFAAMECFVGYRDGAAAARQSGLRAKSLGALGPGQALVGEIGHPGSAFGGFLRKSARL
jgi:hypothetical protein